MTSKFKTLYGKIIINNKVGGGFYPIKSITIFIGNTQTTHIRHQGEKVIKNKKEDINMQFRRGGTLMPNKHVRTI